VAPLRIDRDVRQLRFHRAAPYAMEKLHAEQWCQTFASLYDLDVLSLRYFNVFGPYSLFGGAYSTVLSAWMYHLYVDPDYQPYLEGDGTQTRDFCFVDNVVQANLRAGTRKEQFSGQAYNIAQGTAHSLLDCKDLLEEISGKELLLEQRPPRIGDVKHTLADTSKATVDFGYEPVGNFADQVVEMARWYESSYPPTSSS